MPQAPEEVPPVDRDERQGEKDHQRDEDVGGIGRGLGNDLALGEDARALGRRAGGE